MMDTLTAIANVPAANALQQPMAGFMAPVSPVQAMTNFLNGRRPQQAASSQPESEAPLGDELAGQQQHSGGVDHFNLWQAALQGLITLPLTTLSAMTRPLRVVSQGLEESGFPPLAFRGFQEVDLPPPDGPWASLFETLSAMPLLLPDIPALGAMNPASWTPEELAQVMDYLRTMFPADGRLVIPGLGVFSLSSTPQPFNINRPAWADMPWAGPLNPAAFVPATSTVNIPIVWEPIEGPAPAAFNKPLMGPLNPANAYTEPPLPMPNTLTGILDQISDTTPQVAPIINAIENFMDQVNQSAESAAQAPASSEAPELSSPGDEDATPAAPASQEVEAVAEEEVAPETVEAAVPDPSEEQSVVSESAEAAPEAVEAVDSEAAVPQAAEEVAAEEVEEAAAVEETVAPEAVEAAEPALAESAPEEAVAPAPEASDEAPQSPADAEPAEDVGEAAAEPEAEQESGDDGDFGGNFGEVADLRRRRLSGNSERILRGTILNNFMAPVREASVGGMASADGTKLGENILPHPLQAMQPLFDFVRQPFGGDSPAVVQKVRNIWGDVVRPVSQVDDKDRLEAFNNAAFDPKAYYPREKFVQSVKLGTGLDAELDGQYASPWDEEV